MPGEKLPRWQKMRYGRSKFTVGRDSPQFADTQMPTCPLCRQAVRWEIGVDIGLSGGRFYFRCPLPGCGAVISMYAKDIPKTNPLTYTTIDFFWRATGAYDQKMTRIESTGSNREASSLDGRELPFSEVAKLDGWRGPGPG